MRLEHIAVPGSKMMIKKEDEEDGRMSKVQSRQLKELPMSKDGIIWAIK